MDLLKWLQRGLLAVGLISAGWSGLVLTEARFVNAMPVPSVDTISPTSPIAPGSPGRPIPRGTWVARLEAPSVQLSATVLEGSDDRTLNRAAGHIENTALPGQVGNIGIAGHRDTTFRRVRHLKTGDPLVLTTPRKTFEYRISDTMIVKPDNVGVLAPTARSTLTLVTCYPFTFIGHAPKRYVVKAELTRERLR